MSNSKQDKSAFTVILGSMTSANEDDGNPIISANLKVNSDVISSGIDDAELVADSIVFTVRKGQLLMKAESDSSATQLEMQQGDGLKILDMGEPVRARYSVDYLKKIFKARKLAEQVALSMSTDYPMRIVFDVPNKMKMGFILAPRVED